MDTKVNNVQVLLLMHIVYYINAYKYLQVNRNLRQVLPFSLMMIKALIHFTPTASNEWTRQRYL